VREEDDDDEDSSDSIMEVEEDPLAMDSRPAPPALTSAAVKTKTNIVTIDDVKMLQALANSARRLQQQKQEEAARKSSGAVAIDTAAILAAKSSGVTITPAKPRVLPLGTIGSDVTISKVSRKPAGQSVHLPACTTMTSVNSGSAAASAAASPQNSAFGHSKQGQLNDPNLTDDTFVVEAPSFIVPYVYEKPPKETFAAFKKSVEKLESELESKDVAEKEKSDSAEAGSKETAKEKDGEKPAAEAAKKPASESFFDSSLGKCLVNMGMNLVQEYVQADLLREQQRKSQKDKSASVMHAIMSLKKNLVPILSISVSENQVFFLDALAA
jgi:hypothetical protein